MTLHFKNFWYIIAESHELTNTNVLSRQVLDEFLVCYRDENGTAIVLRDRCVHRCGRLSTGSVNKGRLRCPYHGWVYDGQGKVVQIPSMGQAMTKQLQAIRYSTSEQEGYVYVRLVKDNTDFKPFPMQYYKKPGWHHVRLQNLFHNTLSNCVENFIDIPHTAFVHDIIFRSHRNEPIKARIKQNNGEVHVTYSDEKRNLGSFNWFLNPSGREVHHTDQFFMPNITHVTYSLTSKWQYVITSQSVPVNNEKTLVYTDISYQFGLFTPFIKWLIKRQAQKVIDQDICVLNDQMQVIQKYGQHFYDTPADKIHALISEIHQALANNNDPRLLPMQQHEVTFRV